MPPTLLHAPDGEVDKAAAAAALLPVAEAAASAEAATPGHKPAFLPDRFWDAAAGRVDIEALARAYQQLEQQVQGMVAIPGPDDDDEVWRAFDRARGVPDDPEAYQIDERHPLLGADPELNAVLHAAGFTPDQVQLVYDLAHDRVLPVLEDLAAEFEADRQLVRLIDHFGGEEAWRTVSRQINAWGKANLPPELFTALATTYEGVIALHRLMDGGEPALAAAGGSPGGPPADEAGLKALMRDPRYWRERDPALMRQVADGFRRLYPGK